MPVAPPSLSYSPDQVHITFMGTILRGFADGTFIKVSRDEDSYMKQVGAGGEGARVKNLNRAGKVTLTLMQTALANDVLSGAQSLDELSGTGHGALLIKDLNGNTLVTAPDAWVQKPADVELGKELGHREWTLDTLALQIFVGGNAL